MGEPLKAHGASLSAGQDPRNAMAVQWALERWLSQCACVETYTRKERREGAMVDSCTVLFMNSQLVYILVVRFKGHLFQFLKFFYALQLHRSPAISSITTVCLKSELRKVSDGILSLIILFNVGDELFISFSLL